MSKLVLIKCIHTFIWVFFNVVLFYLAYSVINDEIDIKIWIGIGCIVAEAIVLLSFKWKCPFTILARKYSSSTKDNFDIYIPNWLARYNKLIYTIFFVLIIGGLVYRLVTHEN